jgi:hypothetical protein
LEAEVGYDSGLQSNPQTVLVLQHVSEHIWAMTSPDEKHIGIRFDCGDAGVLWLNENQAGQVFDILKHHLNRN